MIQIRHVFSVILYMKKFDYDFQILTESFLIDVVLALWSFYFEFFSYVSLFSAGFVILLAFPQVLCQLRVKFQSESGAL